MPPTKTLALLLAVPLASSTLVLGQDDPATPPTQQQPQQQPQRPAPGTREAMWPAPSAADWAKPCLIQWERSWEDALAVAEETGKPMLVCVNMDGELASEHYAGVRYRMQEIADLYAPYICVMASVYRHNPSDYDHEGNRIPCPRFGHVTCGEHIAIEPVLYEKYFEGTRVAPRHIMIELDREEQYDVYYAFDTQSVFDTIVQGVQNRENPIPPVNREDRPIEERVNSRAHLDKVAVEQAFRAGDVSVRRKLLRRAVEARDNASVDLLRLAIFGFDVELARLGREGLLYSNSEKAIDLIGEALRVPLPTEERERLIAALERLGETYPRARTLARVHTGLGGDSQLVDLDGWSEVEAGRPQPREWSALESAVDYSTQRATSAPEDGAAHLDVAESTLAIAVDPRRTGGLITGARTDQKFSELLFLDAQASARKAEQLGASGWRLDAMLSLTAWYLGDREEGYRRAEQAVAALPAGAQDWSAMGVLSLFADQRRRDITQALRAREEWPPAWLTDLHAAYAVLARHPYGTDGLVIDQIDFLNYMGAFAPAAQLLDVGMQRFPDSALMHDRLRSRILREAGVAGLEAAYERMLAGAEVSPNLPWFAGYTSVVAAEFHRRAGDPIQATAAYDRAIAHFDSAIELVETNRDSADHYAALALAGQARLAFEGGDLEGSAELLLASFERRELTAASIDGLNIHPVGTANLLISRLDQEGNSALAARLRGRLAAMPPELLQPPAFDRGGAPSTDAQRAARRRRGGR